MDQFKHRLINEDGYLLTYKINENKQNKNTIKLIACGDTGPVRKLEKVVAKQGSPHVLGEMKSILNRADIVFANLEATFSNRGIPMDRIPVFRLKPEVFDIIKDANIKIVSLANNHMFDYGAEAFIDTTRLLKKNNILYFGAGLTINDALNPLLIEIKGLKIGFLGFREKEAYWFDNNGVITPQINKDLILKCIKKLKPKVDFLILSLHFGWEYQSYPDPRDVMICRRFISEGVNLILGHHPHYPQGIEKYKNGVVVYSLGNFIWDQNFIGHTSSSYILELEITKNNIISIRAIPFEMNRNYQLKIRRDKYALDELNKISYALLNNKILNEKWYFICRNKFIEFLDKSKTIFNNKNYCIIDLLKEMGPRFRHSMYSLLLFILSGKALKYELKKGFKKRLKFLW